MEIIKNISHHGSRPDRFDNANIAEHNGSHSSNWAHGYPERTDHSPPIDTLAPTFLYSNRIIAFDSSNSMAHAYDVLRNHLVIDDRDLPTRTIAVSSPSSGCGTTVTAINLALSFARVPGANVLLVDANARNPCVGKTLGLAPEPSYVDPVYGWTTSLDIGGINLSFLRAAWGEPKTPLPVDLSRMTSQTDLCRQVMKPTHVILDLPPLLNSDEVIPFIEMSDTVVVVLAVGKSKLSDLQIGRSYIGPTKRTQVLLNKTRRHDLR